MFANERVTRRLRGKATPWAEAGRKSADVPFWPGRRSQELVATGM